MWPRWFFLKGFLSCPLDSEEEYFDALEGSKSPEKSPVKPRALKSEAEAVQEELTDLQLKFEIREASAGLFFCSNKCSRW